MKRERAFAELTAALVASLLHDTVEEYLPDGSGSPTGHIVWTSGVFRDSEGFEWPVCVSSSAGVESFGRYVEPSSVTPGR